MIWAFPVKAGDEFCTAPRNIAAQRDLYSFCSPRVDAKLSDLESMLGRFWPTLAQERYPVDQGFRKGIGLFIATLYMRHPAQLARQRRFTASMAKTLNESPKDEAGRTRVNQVEIRGKTYDIDSSELDRYRTATDEEIQNSWGDLILAESGQLAQQLIEKPWTVLVTDEPAFITTDHPVALFNASRDDAPILHPETAIYFPLTPQKLVVINQREDSDGHIVKISNGDEAPFNYAIFRSAYQHVFTAWDSVYMLDQICRFADWARDEWKRH